MIGQTKTDTISFTLHCLESEVYVEEDLSNQLDSIYAKYGFNDIDLITHIDKAIIFGHTDSKGSEKSNQKLSLERAEYVYSSINVDQDYNNNVVLGFGETKPIADNATKEGRDKNRRVEVMLIYTQKKVEKAQEISKTIPRDTIITFEDGTQLKINVNDYRLVKNCLKYERKTSLYDLFDDLATNEDDRTYYNFGKVSIRWCNTKCLESKITLSVKVPDTLIKAYLKEIKLFVKTLRSQQAKLQKHRDNIWYIDAYTYCPFEWQACRIWCATKGGSAGRKKRVKFVTKDGYRIIAASYSHGTMSKFKKIKSPRRKIKFKTTCPGELPYVSIIAVHNNSLDTVYYMSGQETTIDYSRRCFNCVDREEVVGKFIGIKIHKRLLRRKYIFRQKNVETKIMRKIKIED